MADKRQATAREYIDRDLTDAIDATDDVKRLLPHAGLPKSPALTGKLREARAALVAAKAIASRLAQEEGEQRG